MLWARVLVCVGLLCSSPGFLFASIVIGRAPPQTFANGTPCNMVSEEDECAHRSECKWHDDVEACTHTDEHPPCDKANSRRECQALKCDWHKPTNTGSQGMCVTPGEKIDCGSFHTETECDTSRNALDHCEWLEHSHICQDKGTPVDCQSLYGIPLYQPLCFKMAPTFVI